ncbi:hypothetical protein ACFIQF_01745 [Comamonas sp. J-3]|uniref:hypothetical protein n=1 Tax=Comamonas trifloxystrobinivorans TaxID=3350256 RepID=UPI0037266B54
MKVINARYAVTALTGAFPSFLNLHQALINRAKALFCPILEQLRHYVLQVCGEIATAMCTRSLQAALRRNCTWLAAYW